jgi:Carboxypeptidase regulatory-like domain
VPDANTRRPFGFTALSRLRSPASYRPLPEVFSAQISGNAFALRCRVNAPAHVTARRDGFHSSPLSRLVVCLIMLLCATACGRGGPAIDMPPQPAPADGTIHGTVRGPQGTTALDGRLVEVVNVSTGQRQRVTTNTAGAFSFKLKPGRYRVEVPLRGGETLIRQPGVIELDHHDEDARADVVLGTVRVARPRSPAYRSDDGLGSPIA